MEESKACTCCGETKPLEDYHRDRTAPDGRSRYCKQCKKEKQDELHQQRPFSATVNGKRSYTKKKGIPFDLDEQYLADIWTGFCPVFKTKLRLPCAGSRDQRYDKHCPSLDRIRWDKGYVKGNVIWISNYANTLKGRATPEELTQVATWLHQTEKEIAQHEAD